MQKQCALLICVFQVLLISSNAQVLDMAQIPGCTDPLANNFNPSATVNDGSCIYDPYSVFPSSTNQMDEIVSESSGLMLWDGYVWTHNDNADNTLYGLNTLSAEIEKTYELDGVSNRDWEEIQQDDQYIYIGDVGNNGGNRTDLHLLRIAKQSLTTGAPVIDTIGFSYSDQLDFNPPGAQQTDFDCEAFIVTNDSIYLFTKQWISAQTCVYSLPKTPGTFVAQKIDSYNTQGLVTGAAFLESSRLLALCGYTSLLHPFLWLCYDYMDDNYFSGNKRRVTVSLPFHQVEGIATVDGLNFFVSNEAFRLPPAANSPQKLHLFDLEELLVEYIESVTRRETIYQPGRIKIYPNPSDGFIAVSIPVDLCPLAYKVIDLSSRILQEGILREEYSSVDISQLKPGSYYVCIDNYGKGNFKFVKY